MIKNSQKTTKRLALAKETLKALCEKSLDKVAGGGLPEYATVSRCPHGC